MTKLRLPSVPVSPRSSHRTEVTRDVQRTASARRLVATFRSWHRLLTLPLTVLFLFSNPRIHPAYGMNLRKALVLALRMYRNTRRVFTGTSYKAHLAMTVKLLEIPPEVDGVVVECGCFLGGSTANLSLACELVDRELFVYDSFEGLPEADPRDRYAKPERTGALRADLEQVRATVAELGAVDRCTFVKGWFHDTLPEHDRPVVLCFFDVDYQSSLHDCVLELWPHLTPRGLVFIDEYVFPDYCALFFSERYWSTYFDTTPPGLLGAGSGIGLGEYYLGPFGEKPPIQSPGSVAYTRKDFCGQWSYFPEPRR